MLFIKNDPDFDDKIQLRDFVFSGFSENLENLYFKLEMFDKFNYFDYEHFYVFCYLFNKLDDDDDGFIGRSEFEKYSKHNISSITIDRIFSGVGIKFKNAGNSISVIDFADFIKLILFEEDKMTTPSINFWFKILDLDSDGILRYDLIESIFELEWFFKMNQKKMMAIEGCFYEWKDVLCLIMDMLGVDRPYFTLEDLLARHYFAPHFINIFTNFGKFKSFIERESYITPVKEQYSDFIEFYKRSYERYTNVEQQVELEVTSIG